MKLLFLLLFGLSFETVVSQNFQYKYYTEKDGLSTKSVDNFCFDSEGFLWIGTPFGLNRFDGNTFDKFYNIPIDSASIADNNIQKIFEDSKKRIWLGTNAGVSLFIPKTRSFKNFEPDSTLLTTRGITFSALCEDNEGNIWVGTKSDLLIFDSNLQKFSSSGWANFADKVAPPNSLKMRVIVLSIIKKSLTEFWILSTYGLFSVNTETKQFQFYQNPNIPDFYGCELHYADSIGNVWISTYYYNLLRFNSVQNKWSSYKIPKEYSIFNNAYSVVPYSNDTLMVCSGNALLLFDAQKEKFLNQIDFTAQAEGNFKKAETQTVIRKNGIIWLGTSEGLVKINHYQNDLKFTALTDSERVYRVFKNSQSNIIFNKIGKTYTTFCKTAEGKTFPLLNEKNESLHCQFQYFLETPNGNSFLNGNDNVYQYNSLTQKLESITLPSKNKPTNDYDIRNMVVDKNGTIWIRAVSQGIIEYQPSIKTIQFQNNIPLHGEKEINALYYDKLTHSLWVSEEFNGVFVYDIDKKTTQHFPLNAPPLQKKAAITNISGDGNGNIYMIDLQSGMIEYNFKSKTFSRYNVYNGLLSNNCLWSVCDSSGFVWVITDAGLCQYAPIEKKFTYFSSTEGFPTTFESFFSSDKNGSFFLPYKNGFLSWNSASMKAPQKTGELYLKEVLLFNKPLPIDSSYRFEHQENNIRFLVGLKSFDNRENISLEYSLNGVPFFDFKPNTYISFANLSPGNYSLYCRLKNENIPYLHLTFKIDAPFWQKGWFIILAILLGILLISFFVRRRLNQIRKEYTLLQKINEAETLALRSQMNPHFIFNTLNSINSFIIENKKEEASEYLTDFSRLIRIILNHTRLKSVTLAKELSALKLYLDMESRRLEKKFVYKIIVADDIDTQVIQLPPLIIQPFAENAIWHGIRNKIGVGTLTVDVKKIESGILISVTDDGIGREATKKFQKIKENPSFGTSITEQRMALSDSKSKIEIIDLYNGLGEATGACVKIYLNSDSKK